MSIDILLIVIVDFFYWYQFAYSPPITYMTTLPEKRYRKIYIFYNIRLDDICR